MNFVNKVKAGQRYLYKQGKDTVLVQVLEDTIIDTGSLPTYVLGEAIQNYPGSYQWALNVENQRWPFSIAYFNNNWTLLEGQDAPGIKLPGSEA